MDSIVGNFSFLGSHRLAKRQAAGDKSLYPEPVSLFDVRRVLTQYCMLPLGSQAVHETQPVHVKSVMLTGSHGTGKTTFAMAAAHELGVRALCVCVNLYLEKSLSVCLFYLSVSISAFHSLFVFFPELTNMFVVQFQANFFDLSPSNTAGKYTAKKGVDGVEGMIHKVRTMLSRLLSLRIASPHGILTFVLEGLQGRQAFPTIHYFYWTSCERVFEEKAEN